MANVEWTGEKAEVLHCMESPRDGEVYVPFTFVKKYFDVRGRLHIAATAFLLLMLTRNPFFFFRSTAS